VRLRYKVQGDSAGQTALICSATNIVNSVCLFQYFNSNPFFSGTRTKAEQSSRLPQSDLPIIIEMRNGMRGICRPCLEVPNACVFFVVSTKTVAGPVRIPSAGNSNSRCEICAALMHMPPTRSPGTPLFEWCPFFKCNRHMMTNQAPSSDHC